MLLSGNDTVWRWPFLLLSNIHTLFYLSQSLFIYLYLRLSPRSFFFPVGLPVCHFWACETFNSLWWLTCYDSLVSAGATVKFYTRSRVWMIKLLNEFPGSTDKHFMARSALCGAFSLQFLPAHNYGSSVLRRVEDFKRCADSRPGLTTSWLVAFCDMFHL